MLHSHDPGYRFCPRCGNPLAHRCIKTGEPDRLCCEGCEFVFYLDPKLAAGVIATVGEEILLLRRAIEPAYGTWVFPGGFVDRGEHPEEAAVREAREEAGVEVRLDGILGIYSHPPGSTVVLVVYHGAVTAGEPAALDESLEFGLFPPRAVPWSELAFATTRLAFADYVRRVGLEPPAEVERRGGTAEGNRRG
jgi:ADP-ribose pyrophosphatase YjhB (NUDIX family)